MLLRCIEMFQRWKKRRQDHVLSMLSGQIKYFRERRGYYVPPPVPKFPVELHLAWHESRFRAVARRYGMCPNAAAAQYGI